MERPPPGQKALNGARSGSFLSPYVMRLILMTLGVMSPNLVLSLEASGFSLQSSVFSLGPSLISLFNIVSWAVGHLRHLEK